LQETRCAAGVRRRLHAGRLPAVAAARGRGGPPGRLARADARALCRRAAAVPPHATALWRLSGAAPAGGGWCPRRRRAARAGGCFRRLQQNLMMLCKRVEEVGNLRCVSWHTAGRVELASLCLSEECCAIALGLRMLTLCTSRPRRQGNALIMHSLTMHSCHAGLRQGVSSRVLLLDTCSLTCSG